MVGRGGAEFVLLEAYNFKKGLQSDLQSAIVLARAKTYKDMYDVAVENETDIKRKVNEESNKKMKFTKLQGLDNVQTQSVKQDQFFVQTGPSRNKKHGQSSTVTLNHYNECDHCHRRHPG
ncbi:hypothetical protein ACH5RR_019821 [Cinchona calisaya]|uniref:Uncharacterized protein n=1 Tax=Cinchona calisaya TaxID=153742 RepID=A0ABD2ZU21_9GENT